MKNVKRRFVLEKKGRILIGIMAVLAGVFITIAYLNIRREVGAYTLETVKNTIISTNERSAVIIQNEINDKQKLLCTLADTLTKHEVDPNESILAYLDVCAEAYGFYNMGIILPDGTGYTNKGVTLSGIDFEYYKNTPLTIENVVSEDGENADLSIFTASVKKNGEIAYILSASYRSEEFAEMLNIGHIFAKGSSVVLDSEGKSVVEFSGHLDSEYERIGKAINDNPNIVPSDDVKEDNYVTFEYEGTQYYGYMTKLNINDWYYMSFIAKDAVLVQIGEFQKYVFSVLAILFVCIVAILIVVWYLFFRYQKRLYNLTYIDRVTGGENYEYLEASYNEKRNKNAAVVAIDIDDFNTLNTMYGSSVGDEVLRYIYRVFSEEAPNDEIYRKHSDHFICVMKEGTREQIEAVMHRIMYRMRSDMAKGYIVPFTVSLGISCIRNSDDLYTAYTDAIIAKDTIKRNSDIKYAFFDSKIKRSQILNMELNSSFEEAVLNKEFQVYYQPKYDMRTKEVIGSEALIRWIKEDGTMVSPGEFIECFESSGKIVFLDELMIEMVCSQMHNMTLRGIDVKKVSINLSRVHIRRPSYIIGKIKHLIDEYQIDPSKISFEITESAFYNDSTGVNHLVESLHCMGCEVDMDDFGTGMSGLSVLTRTKFDTIKLDRSFIVDLDNRKTKTVVESTIDMISKLGLGLIVEGVETEDQAEFLVSNNCRFAQGFLYSRPITSEEYRKLLAQNSK